MEGWPGWLGAFVEHGWRPHPDKRWTLMGGAPNPSLAGIGGNEWCDVYAFARYGYQRYGYNLTEKRWSYDRPPPGAKQIARELAKPPARSRGGFKALIRRVFGG